MPEFELYVCHSRNSLPLIRSQGKFAAKHTRLLDAHAPLHILALCSIRTYKLILRNSSKIGPRILTTPKTSAISKLLMCIMNEEVRKTKGIKLRPSIVKKIRRL